MQDYTNLDKIFKLQKRIFRIIAHTRPLFLNLKLIHLYDINKLATGTFVYKCLNNSLSLHSIFGDYFTLNNKIHNYTTRSANKICITKARMTTRKMTLRHSRTFLWPNSLDRNLLLNANLRHYFRTINYFYLPNWIEVEYISII